MRAACKSAYAQCKAGWTRGSCNMPDPACTATVAEFAACVNDSFAYIRMALESLPSCDALTSAFVFQQQQGSAPPTTDAPQSCQDYELKCPGATK